ncbi:MAG TPA: M2 family metallopeptidase [Verrucomicrobiae bacterium]|nr:M2 family metallopeptidase [Verrucomicrobiae bacterium]
MVPTRAPGKRSAPRYPHSAFRIPHSSWALAIWAGLILAADGAGNSKDPAAAFVSWHERVVRPLEYDASLTWWKANTTGKDEDFQAKEEAQNKLDAVLADPKRFAELEAARKHRIKDPILKRELEVLHLQYLEKQVDPGLLQRITAKANAIEKAFNVFRAKIGDQEFTDSQVRRELKESKDSARRREIWEASKAVGAVVEKDLLELVGLRNEAARHLGYRDYHVLQLQLNEQDQDKVLKLFDQLDRLTREPFQQAKAALDRRLAAQCGIRVEQLRPWHYHDPFFQEAPAISTLDLDTAYTNADIVKICANYYAGIGLPIDDVLARSDLLEKPGKSPHAFCTDLDRNGDVRVLANVVPNLYWMSTMLHELGHAVYSSKNIPPSVPYVLRTEAHILATEGVAMMFERPAANADWLKAMGVSVPNPTAFNEAGAEKKRLELLIFSRWCQVMLRFERELYRDPRQDLNKLWWDLVENYQMIKRPEDRAAPDYASKIHIVTSPAYYHNYMLGQLFASQLHHAIAREVLKMPPNRGLYVGNPAVGEFLKRRVFAPGRTLPWNELTEFATGEALNPNAFAADFRQ